jgi:hypothetical protein
VLAICHTRIKTEENIYMLSNSFKNNGHPSHANICNTFLLNMTVVSKTKQSARTMTLFYIFANLFMSAG